MKRTQTVHLLQLVLFRVALATARKRSKCMVRVSAPDPGPAWPAGRGQGRRAPANGGGHATGTVKNFACYPDRVDSRWGKWSNHRTEQSGEWIHTDQANQL